MPVPKCKYCGRGFLLKASPDGVGYVCESGCNHAPEVPHLNYITASSRKTQREDT
jgi:hypothetical protein